MEFTVHPYIGIEISEKGLIKFGSTRKEVRKYFDEKPEEFLKSRSSSITTDAFSESSVHIFYNEADRIEAFEFNSNAILVFQGENIFSIYKSKEIELFFAKLGDTSISKDSCTMNFEKFGISIYFIDSIEGVMVYSRKYLK